MDPQLTKDGRPYAPYRFKEIARERYIISKAINTSYNDIGKITPTERNYILEFISDDIKRSQQMFDDQVNQAKTKR